MNGFHYLTNDFTTSLTTNIFTLLHYLQFPVALKLIIIEWFEWFIEKV